MGNDVWVGMSAVVLPGVNVADGAVIGAGSVVTKNVPPYAIVAGNPAKVLKYRFPDNIIDRLLSLQWWNFSDEMLRESSELFKSFLDVDVLERLEALKHSRLSN